MPQDSELANIVGQMATSIDPPVGQGRPVAAANAGQSMADPGNAAETAANVLAGAGNTFNESPGAAPAQNNAPQLQNTVNSAEGVIGTLVGNVRK
ncbi:hypothetical protein AtubIFM61612_004254 [Aspergillus tubingensis]|nr:hypothetical protein AtubIFM57143_003949 [Aspergillus tubingensis]GLB23656.1 hypothetical protein AtubIFM61612_004254 [Aspergillus tubingensis]